MTNEEAIHIMEAIVYMIEPYYNADMIEEAVEVAIQALEQQPNTWSLDDAREDFMHDVYNTLDFLPTNEEANRIIDSFDRVTSSIKQQPNRCDSCKHSEEQDGSNCYECVRGIADNFEAQPPKMRDATEVERKSVKDYVESISKPTGFNFYEAQPTDAVSRETVKEQMIKYGFKAPDMTVTEFVEDCLPPVTPQIPNGNWIYIGNSEVNGLKICECSVCEKRTYGSLKYCPNCGAEMEVDHE